jgi:YD repeat-containing protein
MVVTRFYDAADRMIEERDVHDKSTIYKYDATGNAVAVTDGNNHVTRWYDAMNRRTVAIDANGNRTETT